MVEYLREALHVEVTFELKYGLPHAQQAASSEISECRPCDYLLCLCVGPTPSYTCCGRFSQTSQVYIGRRGWMMQDMFVAVQAQHSLGQSSGIPALRPMHCRFARRKNESMLLLPLARNHFLAVVDLVLA